MGDAAPLILNISADRAREAVAATLSEQGFVVRERGGILEVERDAHPESGSSVASRVSFLVRFAADDDRTIAYFGEAGGGAVVTAAARVARARLAERGFGAAPADAAAGPADRAADLSPTQHPMPHGATGDAVVPAPAEGLMDSNPAAGDSDEPGPHGTDALTAVETSPVPGPPSSMPPHDVEVPAPPLPGDSPSDTVVPSRDPGRPVNVIAMLAFVLGFVAPVGGIVAGAFALGILRRTREAGRGLAIAGIVVGSVLTVVITAAVVAGLSWLVVDAAKPSPVATTPSPSPSASSVPMRPETPSPAFQPRVGECFAQRGRGEIGEANLVDCSTPHTYELYAQFAVADHAAAYPGDENVAHSAEAGCVEAFTGFVGLAYDRSALDYVYLSPTRKTWATGDRLVSCLVTDAAGPVTGTLRDAGR